MAWWTWLVALAGVLIVVAARRPLVTAGRWAWRGLGWIARAGWWSLVQIPYQLRRFRRWVGRRSAHVVAWAGSFWSRPAALWRGRTATTRRLGHRVLEPLVVASAPVRRVAHRGFARVTGLERFVSGPAAVIAALDGVEATGRAAPLLHTVYGERLDALQHPFVLGENRSDDVASGRGQVTSRLAADERAARIDAAVLSVERLSTALVSASEGFLDAVGGLIVPCAERAMARFLGASDEAGGQLFAAGQLLLHRVFLNPASPVARADWYAERAARAATKALGETLARLDPDGRPDDELDPDELAARYEARSLDTMVATAIGPHVAWACSRTLDELLRHPSTVGPDSPWAAAHGGGGDGWSADGVEDPRVRLLLEAMRHHPVVPGLIRHCPHPQDLPYGHVAPDGIERRRPLRTGATFVYTRSAEFDRAHCGGRPVLAFAPDRFAPGVASAPPTMSFGSGLHECLGKRVALRLMIAMLGPLLSRDGVRRDLSIRGLLTTRLPRYSPLKSSGRWPFPTRLYVRFDAGVASSARSSSHCATT